jgi:hypothetical protein
VFASVYGGLTDGEKPIGCHRSSGKGKRACAAELSSTQQKAAARNSKLFDFSSRAQ